MKINQNDFIQNGQNKSIKKNKFKIAHSLQELQQQMILTLKDQSVLKGNKQLNNDQDLFQNEQLQTFNRIKHNTTVKNKIKQLTDVTTSHIQNKLQGINQILPHYDDFSYKPQQIEVQENGLIKKLKPKTFKNTQSDFLSKDQLAGNKLASEYNAVKIKRPSKRSNSEMVKRQQTYDLLSFLNQTAQDNTQKQDQNKRNASQAIEDALDSIRKKRIIQYNNKRQVQTVDISSLLNSSEEQQLLNKSIRNAQKKNIEKFKPSFLQSLKEEDQSDNQNNQKQKQSTVQIQLNPISYRGQDKKYLRKEYDFDGMKSGTTSAMFVKLPSERLAKRQQNQPPQSFKDISPEQLQKMRQQVSFLQDKALGTGLSGTLQFLRQNALLNKEQEVGRTNDKTINYNDPNDRVKLEYRNQSGKLMKPKQAFRYLCATFHGQGPSKNKIQKRKRKQLQQIKAKQRLNTGGQLMSMLSEHQKKSNQSYMVIDVGKKAAHGNKSA